MMHFQLLLMLVLIYSHNTCVAAASHSDAKAKGELFLQEISQREGVYTLSSGMLIEILQSSDIKDTAKSPNIGDTCKVSYTGTFMDGSKFDSGTAKFAPNQVIKGWTEAMQLMGEGDKWKLYIPYNLAYGERGTGRIPAFSPLIFEIEIHKVLSGGKSITEARALFQKAVIKFNQVSVEAADSKDRSIKTHITNDENGIITKKDLLKNIRQHNHGSNNNRETHREGDNSSKKVHFPHVVGMLGAQAETIIKQQNPNVKVSFVKEGSMVTMDFREDRVRVYLDKEGKVSRAPRVG